MKELRGTEKQIRWAEDIRKKIVKKIPNIDDDYDKIWSWQYGVILKEKGITVEELRQKVIEYLENQDEASFWIELNKRLDWVEYVVAKVLGFKDEEEMEAYRDKLWDEGKR